MRCCSLRKTVFINASLSSLAERAFNAEIEKVTKELGFQCYLPQAALPPEKDVRARNVFLENMEAIAECDILLSVLDKPGLGVVFELGYAKAMGKDIIAFRSDEQDYLGKVVEGLWEGLPDDCKARTLDELRFQLSTRLGG